VLTFVRNRFALSLLLFAVWTVVPFSGCAVSSSHPLAQFETEREDEKSESDRSEEDPEVTASPSLSFHRASRRRWLRERSLRLSSQPISLRSSLPGLSIDFRPAAALSNGLSSHYRC
jgi:hypothetical protein